MTTTRDTDAAFPPGRLSRRDLLRAAALGSAAVGLAACAPGSSPSASASATKGSRTPGPTPTDAPTATETTAPTSSPSPAIPLASRIARLLVVGFRGTDAADIGPIRAALAERDLGGVILFDRDQESGGRRNVESPEQLRALVSDLQDLARGRNLLVAIDQEGGRVARLSPATGFPSVESEARIGGRNEDAVAAWAKSMVSTLADVGINFNLAPVVDLDINPSNPAIGALERSFSADPNVVVRDARIEMAAHRAAGIRTTMKHFPGLGSATTNTDFGVADVTDTWSRTELEPFRALIESGDADSVMVGHLVNGQLDPNAPSSLSRATVTGLLRDELGWDGVVITDDLQAAAITEAFGDDQAIVMALEAGCDLLLFANQQVYRPDIVDLVVDVVTAAVDDGRLDEERINESYARVLAFTS